MDLDIQKTNPVTEPVVQLNIGAQFTFKDPPGEKAHGHVDARDPISGKVKWSVDFPSPPLASLLSTAGGLVFVPDARGWLHALDAQTAPCGNAASRMTFAEQNRAPWIPAQGLELVEVLQGLGWHIAEHPVRALQAVQATLMDGALHAPLITRWKVENSDCGHC